MKKEKPTKTPELEEYYEVELVDGEFQPVLKYREKPEPKVDTRVKFTKEQLFSGDITFYNMDEQRTEVNRFDNSRMIYDPESGEYVLLMNQLQYQDKDIKVYSCCEDSDLLYFELKGVKTIFEINEYHSCYRDKDTITFTGWDDNILLNVKTGKLKTKHIR